MLKNWSVKMHVNGNYYGKKFPINQETKKNENSQSCKKNLIFN